MWNRVYVYKTQCVNHIWCLCLIINQLGISKIDVRNTSDNNTITILIKSCRHYVTKSLCVTSLLQQNVADSSSYLPPQNLDDFPPQLSVTNLLKILIKNHQVCLKILSKNEALCIEPWATIWAARWDAKSDKIQSGSDGIGKKLPGWSIGEPGVKLPDTLDWLLLGTVEK